MENITQKLIDEMENTPPEVRKFMVERKPPIDEYDIGNYHTACHLVCKRYANDAAARLAKIFIAMGFDKQDMDILAPYVYNLVYDVVDDVISDSDLDVQDKYRDYLQECAEEE